VIGLPPLDDGSPNRIVTLPSPTTALTLRGTVGTKTAAAFGVTTREGRDGAPVPLALRALTAKESAVPLVGPESFAYPVDRNRLAGTLAARAPSQRHIRSTFPTALMPITPWT
jgi:hypothetical protein